jgi:hypothetical protein
MMRKGDYDSAKRALGIEDWEEPAEVEDDDGADNPSDDDDDDDEPGFIERKTTEARAKIEELKGGIEEAGGLKKLLKKVKG